MTRSEGISHVRFFASRSVLNDQQDHLERRESSELIGLTTKGSSAAVRGGSAAEILNRLSDDAISDEVKMLAWKQLGVSYSHFGKWDRAKECFESGLAIATVRSETSETGKDLYFALARSQVALGNTAEATALMEFVRRNGESVRTVADASKSVLIRFHIDWDTDHSGVATMAMARHADTISGLNVESRHQFAQVLAEECAVCFGSGQFAKGCALFDLALTHVIAADFVHFDDKLTLLHAAYNAHMDRRGYDIAEMYAHMAIEYALKEPDTSGRFAAYAMLTRVHVTRTDSLMRARNTEAALASSEEGVESGRLAGSAMLQEALKMRAYVLGKTGDHASRVEVLTELIDCQEQPAPHRPDGTLSDTSKQNVIENRLSRVRSTLVAHEDRLEEYLEVCELDLLASEEYILSLPVGGVPDLEASLFSFWYKFEAARSEHFEIRGIETTDSIEERLADPELEYFPYRKLALLAHRADVLQGSQYNEDPIDHMRTGYDEFYHNGRALDKVLAVAEKWPSNSEQED